MVRLHYHYPRTNTACPSLALGHLRQRLGSRQSTGWGPCVLKPKAALSGIFLPERETRRQESQSLSPSLQLQCNVEDIPGSKLIPAFTNRFWESCSTSVQPAFLLLGCGKRARHSLISVFNLLSCSLSASSPCLGDSVSLPCRQDVHWGSVILFSLLCLVTFFLPKEMVCYWFYFLFP